MYKPAMGLKEIRQKINHVRETPQRVSDFFVAALKTRFPIVDFMSRQASHGKLHIMRDAQDYYLPEKYVIENKDGVSARDVFNNRFLESFALHPKYMIQLPAMGLFGGLMLAAMGDMIEQPGSAKQIAACANEKCIRLIFDENAGVSVYQTTNRSKLFETWTRINDQQEAQDAIFDMHEQQRNPVVSEYLKGPYRYSALEFLPFSEYYSFEEEQSEGRCKAKAGAGGGKYSKLFKSISRFMTDPDCRQKLLGSGVLMHAAFHQASHTLINRSISVDGFEYNGTAVGKLDQKFWKQAYMSLFINKNHDNYNLSKEEIANLEEYPTQLFVREGTEFGIKAWALLNLLMPVFAAGAGGLAARRHLKRQTLEDMDMHP